MKVRDLTWEAVQEGQRIRILNFPLFEKELQSANEVKILEEPEIVIKRLPTGDLVIVRGKFGKSKEIPIKIQKDGSITRAD